MPQTYDDIDKLLSRLKRVAGELPEARAPGGADTVPVFQHQRLIDEIKAARDDVGMPLQDVRRPQLAELLAMDRDDAAFLRGLYHHLLGREPDEEGLNNYLRRLPGNGRLFTLYSLAASEESRRHRDQAGIRVPELDAMHARAQRLFARGRPGRWAFRGLKLWWRLVEYRRRERWALQAQGLRLEARLNQLYGQMIGVMSELDGQLGRVDHFLANQHGAAEEVQRLRDEQAALWSTQQHQRRAFERALAGDAPAYEIPPARVEQEMLDAYYVAFEAACRGSEAQIRAHLRHYLVQLDQARRAGTQALDLGCGRGEWLALLAEEGFSPRGIDLNIAMVEHCRSQGFDARHQDALSALRELPDDSQALVSGFHIAEHLPFDTLYAMVDEARRVLAPGGVLILETPNPENLLVGSHTFYHDPTHRNPLTPTAMTFLLTYHGFGEVEVRRFNPYPEEDRVPGDDPLTERVNGHLCGPQDFAVVGLKVPVRQPGDAQGKPASEEASAP
ncbi:MAG TPA: class I SAM-dependent methyltransferase [Pseudomonas sp.]|nr:class I SAM-dependent methyltransferase [Pseudomonas sp.]